MKGIALAIAGLALAGCQTTGMSQAPAKVLYPVTECKMVKVPVYGMIDRPASGGEVLGGAILGGVIGNQFGKGNGKSAMTALGAIVGGSVANERKQEMAVVDYREESKCETVYK